jgi:hypothetical protein
MATYPEKIRVLVSTTGTNPADFSPLPGGAFIELPDAWNSYSFDLSAYAKQFVYLAINDVSDFGYFMMLDDIRVDMPSKSPAKSFMGYTIYLDGTEVITGHSTTDYTFTNLTNGDHVAGVKAVYSSGESVIATIPFKVTLGIDDIGNNNVKIYPNPSTGLVNISVTESSNIIVSDIAGKIVDKFQVNAETTINFTQSAGVYFVKVESAHAVSTHKLVITK